jgi:hypothetical protein
MWLILFKIFKKSKLFKIGILAILAAMSLVLVLGLFVSQNTLLMIVLKQQENKVFNKQSSSTRPTNDIGPKFQDLGPGNTSGKRGNGLNLLLIDQISVDGYVKELLQLYRDSSEGKLFGSDYHYPLEGLLAKHYNESGTYNGTSNILLKSYLPFDNGEVVWNKAYNGAPPEAMTLKSFNSLAANLAGIDTYFNAIRRSNSPYSNVFQIHIDYFKDSPPSSLNGYNVNKGRTADVYYLPDSLSYLDNQFSSMINTFGMKGIDPIIQQGTYGIWHNGGAGHVEFFTGFGAPSSKFFKYSMTKQGTGKAREEVIKEWQTNIISLPELLKSGTEKYTASKPTLFDSIEKGYAPAIWILVENGYYITPKGFNQISESSFTKQQLASAYNLMYSANISADEVPGKLTQYVQEVWTKYPDYIDQGEFYTVYGNVDGDRNFDKGIFWKLENTTSEAYSNKVKGANPRILHRTNIEVVGFSWDAENRGKSVYAKLLKFAGVGVDPTNPDTYMEKFESEFQPGQSSFSAVLKKIGAAPMSDLTFKMLEYAYNKGGFYYWLGGKALQVSHENFKVHHDFINYQGNPEYYFYNTLYTTKSGTQATKDTPDSDLVNYGQWLYDCSSYVADAYNNIVIPEKGGGELPAWAHGIKISGLLTTITDTSKIKPGDMFVSEDHIFFFLAYNTSGNSMTLDPSETRLFESMTAKVGGLWVLEAPTTGKRVGLRARGGTSDQAFILRRFKALQE